MLYFFYFLVIGTLLILCKVIYNIFPMFGMIFLGILLCFLIWMVFFNKKSNRYDGMDPNRNIKEQENELMQKYLEEANKDPQQGRKDN